MDKTLPPCVQGNYDCQNCSKPLVAQSGLGDLARCDGNGKIYFCRFATPSSSTPACSSYDLQSYACTHGGGSCNKARAGKRRFNIYEQ